MVVVPVNQSGMVLLPDAPGDLKQTCRKCSIETPKDTPLNLEPGFDSRKNRKAVWNATMPLWRRFAMRLYHIPDSPDGSSPVDGNLRPGNEIAALE